MYKNILFDWDGTLVDSLDLWLKTLTKVFKKFNIDISKDEIVDRIFGNKKKVINIEQKKLDIFRNYYELEVQKWMPKVSLNEKVLETLKILEKASIKMGIVSTSSRKSLVPAVKNLKLENYFDFILGIEDVEKTKPDPEIIFKGLEKLKAKIDETILVGDSYNDFLAGKNAGIKTVLFLPKKNQEFYNIKSQEIFSSDSIISDFSKIIEIVD